MENVARVVLAVDEHEVAEEVMHFLDRTGGAHVVATAVDERQLVEAVRQLDPDAVVASPSLLRRGTPPGGRPVLAVDTRESVGIGDVEAQAERAMANIAMLLEEAGGELADIVKVVVYLTDVRYREPVYRVIGRWLKGVFPVSTGLVVTALARPEWVVEIDATAVVSGAAE
jgi:enamine deaminase RidA (YjgF/YER057c/UK114 family)